MKAVLWKMEVEGFLPYLPLSSFSIVYCMFVCRLVYIIKKDSTIIFMFKQAEYVIVIPGVKYRLRIFAVINPISFMISHENISQDRPQRRAHDHTVNLIKDTSLKIKMTLRGDKMKQFTEFIWCNF